MTALGGYEAYPCFDYDRFNNRGRIKDTFQFQTDFLGRAAYIKGARLEPDGVVSAYPNYKWDFGTAASDTIAMVVSSLLHDILTDMTEQGKLPWSDRRKIDKMFRQELMYWSFSHPIERQWSWVRWRGVRLYSAFRGLFS